MEQIITNFLKLNHYQFSIINYQLSIIKLPFISGQMFKSQKTTYGELPNGKQFQSPLCRVRCSN